MSSYECTTCYRVFSRQIDLTRHLKRKTPCYANLICKRCFKRFNYKTHYDDHINRKILCEDKKTEKDLLQLQLEVEKEKTKQEDKKLEAEKEKTKQKELEMKTYKLEAEAEAKTINIETQNVFNINVVNIDSLDPLEFTKDKAIECYSDDIQQMIYNVLKHQYNSSDPKLEHNKCIKYAEKGNFVVKQGGKEKIAKFHDIRNDIIKNYSNSVDSININHGMPSRITHRDASLYDNYLSDKLLDDYQDSVKFSSNSRNNGIVAKTLIKAVKKINDNL